MNTWVSVEDCLHDLHGLPVGGRTIDHLILHHTYEPNHDNWNPKTGVEAMVAFWLDRQKKEGWAHPPGGHFVISPDGRIYQPFGLEVPLNADSDLRVNRTGIAVETVGDFDLGRDVLKGDQEHSVHGLFAAMCVRFGLGPANVYFHRSFPAAHKTCPGTSLNLGTFRLAVGASIPWAKAEIAKG